MSNELDAEAEMARIEQEMQSLIPADDTPQDDPPADDVPADDAQKADADADVEELARSQGHVSYEEWVGQGKDPKAWRPAEEYVRRGELLKTPKPDLIDTVESLRRATEEQAKLFAEQMRVTREREERARVAGYQQAIEEAKARQEDAFNKGDREAHREALEQEQRARQEIERASQPAHDPDLVRWQDEAKWFKEGFQVDPYTGQQVPKNAAVKTFLVHQKDFMLRNPGARVIDSVRYAEKEVREAMPDFFKPKTVQQPVRTQQVETGGRAVSRGPDMWEGVSGEERSLIERMAKVSNIPVKDYLKQFKGK